MGSGQTNATSSPTCSLHCELCVGMQNSNTQLWEKQKACKALHYTINKPTPLPLLTDTWLLGMATLPAPLVLLEYKHTLCSASLGKGGHESGEGRNATGQVWELGCIYFLQKSPQHRYLTVSCTAFFWTQLYSRYVTWVYLQPPLEYYEEKIQPVLMYI